MRRLLTILSLIATMAVQGAKSTDLGKHLSINLRQENIPLEQAQQYFGQWLKLDDKTTFLLFKDETDELGYRHQHYRQQHDGTNIESTRLIVHSKDGKLTHVNGYVSQFDAANARLVPRRVSVPGKEVVLVITPEGLVNAVKDFDPATRDIIYTDVATGRIVKREPTTFYFDGQRNIKSETYYHGEQAFDVTLLADGRYVMADSVRKIFTYDAAGIPDTIPGKYCNMGKNEPDSAHCQQYFDEVLKLAQTKRDAFKMQELSTLTLNLTAAGKQAIGRDSYLYVCCGDVTFLVLNDEGLTFPLTIRPGEMKSPTDCINSIRMNDTDTTTVFLYDDNNAILDVLQIAPTADGGDVPSLKVEGKYKRLTADATLKACGNYAVDAHWGMQRVYDFYKQVLGRDSYDNRGSRIVNIVNPLHVSSETNPILRTQEPNATASSFPMPHMVYGRGDMSEHSDEQTELTTMAHEFTHLVTMQTAVLGYSGEPGALNEAFSDIFGVAVFNHVLNTDGQLPLDYLYAIGQDSERTAESGNTRSLKNPWVNKDPKAIEGEYWRNPEFAPDDGGIHSNCCPLGFWFYLLSEGYQPSRDSLDYTVVDPEFITSVQADGWQGIGCEKAVKLVYRMLVHYLYEGANYRSVYNLSKAAALDLGWGNDSEAYQTLMKCWLGVSPAGWIDYVPLNGTIQIKHTLKTLKAYQTNLSELVDYSGTDLQTGIIQHQVTFTVTDPDKLRSLLTTAPKRLQASLEYSHYVTDAKEHSLAEPLKQFIGQVLADATLPAGYSQDYLFVDTVKFGGLNFIKTNVPQLGIDTIDSLYVHQLPATFIYNDAPTTFASNEGIAAVIFFSSGYPLAPAPDIENGQNVFLELYFVESDGRETQVDRDKLAIPSFEEDEIFKANDGKYYACRVNYRYQGPKKDESDDVQIPPGTYLFKFSSDWSALAPATITFTVTKASGIQSLQPSSSGARQRDAWYTLDGRRLTGQPTAKGLYIHRPATGQTRITLVQ